ncbi:MAG: PAS domain S-box protein [Geobacteraceae bacterium]|nr:PAS domain S-box protein [Geobacteraceae bacterium]
MKVVTSKRKKNSNAVSFSRKYVGNYLNTKVRQPKKVAVSDANQLLEAIIDASPLAIIAMDERAMVTLWNPAAERIFGWKKKEVLGKPYPIVTEEFLSELIKTIPATNEGQLRCSRETLRQHKDGTMIDVGISVATLRNRADAVLGYAVILADITERKKSQQAILESELNYRTIFDAANDAIFVLDAENWRILDVNQKMCEMYGYTRDEVMKCSLEELSAGFPPYSQEDLMQHIQKDAIDQSNNMLEWLAKDRMGSHFWIEVNTKRVIINGAYKVLVVARDITKRKIVEEENKKMQQKLLQASKMAAIGTLASGIAHEINNPNNYILSNAQFLTEVWPDISRVLERHIKEKTDFPVCKLRYSEVGTLIPQMFNGLTEGANRIKSIVTSLKDFARQEMTDQEQMVSVNKVIEAALTMLQNKIRKHTDFFKCNLGEDIPPVKGNFRQLEQVVVNVIVNALEALPNKECNINISTCYIRQLDQVLIKVQDKGVGMTEELQKAIFDPFFTTKHDTGGTGLGLSICFTIVKKHNGTIECFSIPGMGSTFFVKLPASKTD